MRQRELLEGIQVFDKEGNSLGGKSRVRMSVSDVALVT